MLTWRSLVCKCLLKSKMEVYIMYKRVWSDQETWSRNEGGGATSSEAAQEYFGAKWRFAYCCKEWSVDPKISCVIPDSPYRTKTLIVMTLSIIAISITIKTRTQYNDTQYHWIILPSGFVYIFFIVKSRWIFKVNSKIHLTEQLCLETKGKWFWANVVAPNKVDLILSQK